MNIPPLRPFVALIERVIDGHTKYELKIIIPSLRIEEFPNSYPPSYLYFEVDHFGEDAGGTSEVVKYEIKLFPASSTPSVPDSWDKSVIIDRPDSNYDNQRVLVTLKIFNSESGEYDDHTETKYRFIDHIKDSELFGDLHPYVSYLQDESSGGSPYTMYAITPAGATHSCCGMEEDSDDPGNYLLKMCAPPVDTGTTYTGSEISVEQPDPNKVVSITVLEVEDGIPPKKRGKAKVSGATSSEIPNERKH